MLVSTTAVRQMSPSTVQMIEAKVAVQVALLRLGFHGQDAESFGKQASEQKRQ